MQLNSLRRCICAMMLTGLCMLWPAIASADGIDFHIKDATVREAVLRLQRLHDFSIIVESDKVDMERKVSVALSDVPVEKVIGAIFSGQNVTCKVDGKRIIVSNGRQNNTSSSKAATPARTLKGSVTGGSDSEPLIGVSIKNLDNGRAVTTDIDGNFAIEAAPGQRIQFSYVGFEPTSRKVPATGSLDVTMTESRQALNDVVVVGFGSQKKVNLTGAVGVIDSDEINGRPVVSAAQALQGLDPSMNIGINSGKADSGYSIDIRGASSLNGGAPLILVDGIEMELSRVNPNDIESVSILKDAAAAAVYGAKASAGVVLVTTKSGGKQRVKVSYNGRFGILRNTTSTDYITTGYDWAQTINKFWYYSNTGQGQDYFKYTEEDYEQLYQRRFDKTEHPDRPWVVTSEDGSYRYYGNFDWYDYIYKRTRYQQEHNVSVNGGNDKAKYYISGRYYGTEGVMKIHNDPFDSFNMRAKIDLDITKWLRFRTNVGYLHTKMWWPGMKNQQTTFSNAAMGGSPVFVPRNPDGTIVHLTNVVNQGATVLGGMNLMLTYDKTSNQEVVDEATIKNTLEIDLCKGLTVHLSHAYRYSHTFGQYRYNNAPYSSKEGVISWETTSKFRNELIESNYTLYKHNFEAYADYIRSWSGGHNFKAMAGVQYDTRYYRKNEVGVEGNLSEDLNDFNLSTGDSYAVSGGQSRYKTLGIFARLNYDYDGKYLVEISGRADGSSRFWKKNRWGYFPSGSLGWRMSQEKFWEPMRKWWNNAKVRFSVGRLGNQQVSDYLFIEEINTGLTNGNFTFNGSDDLLYAREDAPVSGDLTWETVTTYDWGVDLAFLNNRLNFTGDYYIRNTTDMMMPGASLPGVYGAAEPRTNAADMRTNGWEISLAWRDSFSLLGRTFNYSVHGGLGDYVTEVTRFDNDTRLISQHYVGQRLGEIWGYRVGGLFRTDEEAAAYANEVDCSLLTKRIDATSTRKGLHAGDMKFLDIDGDNKITTGKNTVDDPGDRTVIGNSLPRYSYSFGADFNWYGVDFAILFQGVGRRHWYPGTGEANLFWGPYCRPHNTFLSQQLVDQIWSEDNPDAYFPFPRGYEAYTGNQSQDRTLTVANDRYLQNVAYLRLKNITVGYTLPCLKKYLEQIRIYFSGENLAYWSPMKKHNKYIDPEAAVSGSSYKDNSGEVYNFSKVFTFGIDITF